MFYLIVLFEENAEETAPLSVKHKNSMRWLKTIKRVSRSLEMFVLELRCHVYSKLIECVKKSLATFQNKNVKIVCYQVAIRKMYDGVSGVINKT